MARIPESLDPETEEIDCLGITAKRSRMYARECVDKTAGTLGSRTNAVSANAEYHRILGIDQSRRAKQRQGMATLGWFLMTVLWKTAAFSTLVLTGLMIRPLIHPMFYYWGH
jgi:hypothetical protein